MSKLPEKRGRRQAGTVREGITAKQRQAYDLKKGGATWEECGLAMGCSPQTCRAHAAAAVRNGLEPLPAPYEQGASGAAGHRAAAVISGAGLFAAGKAQFDRKVFMELADSGGVPPRVAAALALRIENQYGQAKAEVKRLTLDEQVKATTDKAQLVLSHIDEVSIAGSSAKDLATAYGTLVDRAQLLGGKPTAVYDVNLRAKLHVLMPQFLAEAKRRGITVEGDFKRVSDSVPVD